MANWLTKLLSPPPGGRNLPAILRVRLPYASPQEGETPQKLPGASVVYGAGASALLVIAIYSLLMGRWFSALVMLFLSACLFGFALHIMRHFG